MVTMEQKVYASWVDWGARLALGALTACFLAYAFVLVEPFVPLDELPELWTLPVDGYLAATGAPTGWGWLRLLDKGDYLNFVGIAMLALLTAVCYARIVPTLLGRGERLQAGLAIAQILVLLAAASGLFAAGH